jgi:hypothetical protein
MGDGVEAVIVLRLAREICQDPKFSGCAVDALRQAAVRRDANPQPAAYLLYQARPPERMLRTILSEPPIHRERFRNRMAADFLTAIDKLIERAKPSWRRDLAKRAGAEATNWAGLTRAEKDRNWVATFEKAVDAEDKRRAIANSLALVNRIYPERNDPAPPDPDPEPALPAEQPSIILP